MIKQVILQYAKSKSVWELAGYVECNCRLYFVPSLLFSLKRRVGTSVVKFFHLGAQPRSVIPYLPIYYNKMLG